MQAVTWAKTQWEALDQADQQAGTPVPGSPLAGDDAKSDPYQVSHYAYHALMAGLDHMHCLHSSLIDAQENTLRFHLHSQFSLIRGGIENAARAVWVIAPNGRTERIKRRLKLQNKEYISSAGLRKACGVPEVEVDQWLKERKDKVVSVAIAAGVLSTSAVKALSPPNYKTIAAEAGEAVGLGDANAEAVWRMCSGLAHGDMSGTVSTLELERVGGTPGVDITRVTVNVENLLMCTQAACMMLKQGIDLYNRRAQAAF